MSRGVQDLVAGSLRPRVLATHLAAIMGGDLQLAAAALLVSAKMAASLEGAIQDGAAVGERIAVHKLGSGLRPCWQRDLEVLGKAGRLGEAAPLARDACSMRGMQVSPHTPE